MYTEEISISIFILSLILAYLLIAGTAILAFKGSWLSKLAVGFQFALNWGRALWGKSFFPAPKA